MRVTWGNSTSGVMFAAQVEPCTVQGKQFPMQGNSAKAGTPCKVWPLEGKRTQGRQAASKAVVYGGGEESNGEEAAIDQEARGRQEVVIGEGTAPQQGKGREVVLLTDQESGEQTIQMRVRADTMSERDRVEARNVFRAAGGLGPGDNEAHPLGERHRSQEKGSEPGEA